MILVGIFLLTVQWQFCIYHPQEPGHDAGELEAGLGQHHRQAPALCLAQLSLVSILVMSLRRLVPMMKVFVMFVVGNNMTGIMRTSN